MPRPGSNFIFLLSLLLVVGASGWFVAKWMLVSEIAASRVAVEAELGRLEVENRRLTKHSLSESLSSVEAPTETAPGATAVDAEKRVRVIVDLHRGGLLGTRPWPHPIRNSLSEAISDVAALLGLSEAEAAVLQQVTESGKQAFASSLKARASVERDGSVVTIVVADAPEARAAYEQMLAAMKTTLGPERYGTYEALGGRDVIERLFERWGLRGTEIKVARATAPPAAFFSQRSVLPRESDFTDSTYYFTHSTAERRTTMLSRTGPVQPPAQFRSAAVYGNRTIADLGMNIGPLVDLVPPDL
jgi:hypothetical protein